MCQKKDDSRKQIEWEFKALNSMDIFSMYFSNSNSVQPICMYELGRHLALMPHRFINNWKDRIIIGIERGYSRESDVIIQTHLATDYEFSAMTNMTPEVHAHYIAMAYKKLT